MFSIFSSTELSSTDRARLRRIEQKLDLIIQHLGLALPDNSPPGMTDEIRALADNGNKIGAIKLYREHNGADLKDAKDASDAYLANRA